MVLEGGGLEGVAVRLQAEAKAHEAGRGWHAHGTHGWHNWHIRSFQTYDFL